MGGDSVETTDGPPGINRPVTEHLRRDAEKSAVDDAGA
jgi:hypothetical protein